MIASTDGIVQTAATLTAFFLAAVLYPDVMRKAQIELDAVVGPDRVPRVEDRARLPYIEALDQEVLRWRPVIPMGFSRRADQVAKSEYAGNACADDKLGRLV